MRRCLIETVVASVMATYQVMATTEYPATLPPLAPTAARHRLARTTVTRT